MFCEKRKRVVSAGSELFNTHDHGIDDTPTTTQEACQLNVTPNANGFNCNTALNWSQFEEGFNGKGGRYSYIEEELLPPSDSPSG